MPERMARSRSGKPVVFADDFPLHSRYDPEKEAETYVQSLKIDESVRFFVLVEPGLGYLIPALRRRRPEAAIIALHVSAFLAEKQAELHPGARVWPGNSAPQGGTGPENRAAGDGTAGSVQDFLEREIPDVPAREIRVIEWRPALEACGEACLALFREAVEFIRRGDAGARTGAHFGRRWLRNFFRNLSLPLCVARPFRTGPETVWAVAGAGPSLEESAASLTALGKGRPLRIMAVSAAWPALKARGLDADLVLAADGGPWAAFHLTEMLRRKPAGEWPVLAFSLCAALPSPCAALPVLPLSDGSLWQDTVLDSLGWPFLRLPSRGTVSALAVDLALALSEGEIILAGMDLAGRDIQAHARPYALDHFQENTASRLFPAHSLAFARSLALAEGGSFRIYAGWFKKQLPAWPGRLKSLGVNHAVFDAIKFDAAGKGFGLPPGAFLPETGPGQDARLSVSVIPPAENIRPVRQAVLALEAALSGPRGDRFAAELGPLLFPEESGFPGKSGAGTAKIAGEIARIAEKYGEPGNF